MSTVRIEFELDVDGKCDNPEKTFYKWLVDEMNGGFEVSEDCHILINSIKWVAERAGQ